MYTALYRAERPEVFSEILGQDHIVRILKNQIATGTESHAYLFCGTRGTGKTTTARILAKAVNCLEPSPEGRPCGTCANCMAIKNGTFLDVIEIDAASNNGVDNIRELRESVNYPPAVGKKKVYIIDEVHMLSPGAFNALLKTLEEPPENVMFILATTDPQKILQTVMSRCVRLDFRRVPEQILVNHMADICQNRGVTISDSALRLLAMNADGSVRDSLSLLDRCLSGGEKNLDRNMVLDYLGTVSQQFFIDLTENVSIGNAAEGLLLLDEAFRQGKDVKQIMKDWMAHYRNLMISKYIKNPEDMLNMSTENVSALKTQGERLPLEEINSAILTLAKTIDESRFSSQPRIMLELALVKIASGFDGTETVKKTPGSSKPRQAVAPVRQKALKQEEQSTSQSQVAEQDLSPKDGATEETKPQKVSKNITDAEELERIWGDFFESGEGELPSLNMVRAGTTLVGINDKEFKVLASTDFMADYMEKNNQLICSIMERITGKRRQLICRLEGEDSSAASVSEEEDKLSETVEALKAMSGDEDFPIKIE